MGVCLLAALAYAVLGGGSSSAPSASSTPPVIAARGLAVSGTTPKTAVAETTDGTSSQQGGSARNPFSALPGSTATVSSAKSSASTSSGASSSSSSTTGSSTGSSSTGGSSGSGGTTKSEPSKKPKATQVYHVAIEFGVLPAGTTPEAAQLTSYENLKLQTALPSAKQPLIVFRGVTVKGRSATFTLIGESILSGTGACLPSATQCQAVDLKPGETEQLSYLQPNGETVVYELRVVSIVGATATTSAVKASVASVARTVAWAVSKAGREVLRRAGLQALPFLRYSSQPGVLVFAPPKASGSRAHAAAPQRRR